MIEFIHYVGNKGHTRCYRYGNECVSLTTTTSRYTPINTDITWPGHTDICLEPHKQRTAWWRHPSWTSRAEPETFKRRRAVFPVKDRHTVASTAVLNVKVDERQFDSLQLWKSG